ncbi:MAG: MAPEG family protein [Rhizobiales bacterium]|nr:MAPEG family protein [Hyphomicrobiales bacterium]
MIAITPVYAALLALFFVFLSIRVVLQRREAKVALGDGGNRPLLRRLRVHGNFAEYVPLALILMLLAELQQAPGWLVNATGILLVAGRVLHAAAVSREPEPLPLRATGMALTMSAIIIGAVTNLVLGIA